MTRVQYHHIGHRPRFGPIALWALGDDGRLHEDRRAYDQPDASWLDWSHDNLFAEVKPVAKGRVELDCKAGSIHISDPALILNRHRLVRIVRRLERAYPRTRWFVFSDGLTGISVSQVLDDRQD
ncbi:MAG: hypothetical protein KF745_00175 [Phycisphaeraceae bacterium]|nr:hypothetical protein [Phycisphaeraceae bacterium]